MALKMRPTGLGSGFYKHDVDYSVFCANGAAAFPSGPALALRISTMGCPSCTFQTAEGHRCSKLPMQCDRPRRNAVRAPALSNRLDRVSSLVL